MRLIAKEDRFCSLGWTSALSQRTVSRNPDFKITSSPKSNGPNVDIQRKAACGRSTVGVEVSDTYWYLTAVPDLMAVAAKNFEQYSLKTKEACNA